MAITEKGGAEGVEGAGPLEGARGLGPATPVGGDDDSLPVATGQEYPEVVARNYQPDLSGANGTAAQMTAIRSICLATLQEQTNQFKITGPGGQAISGRWPNYTLNDSQQPRKTSRAIQPTLARSYIPPFKLIATRDGSDDLAIKIQPGIITNGWGAEGEVSPTVAGLTNTVASPSYLTPNGTLRHVYARVAVSPLASEVETDYWEITNAVTTSAWDIDFYSDADAQAMEIDPSDGTTIQNGVYYRTLGQVRIVGSGSSAYVEVTQHRLGPWEAKFCHAHLTVLSGAFTEVDVTIELPP